MDLKSGGPGLPAVFLKPTLIASGGRLLYRKGDKKVVNLLKLSEWMDTMRGLLADATMNLVYRSEVVDLVTLTNEIRSIMIELGVDGQDRVAESLADMIFGE